MPIDLSWYVGAPGTFVDFESGARESAAECRVETPRAPGMEKLAPSSRTVS